MFKEEIRWGIIGCGDVTEVKSGPAFNMVANSQLLAVMRRDAAKARDYAHRHGVARWFSDADELINNPEVNAIYVATPPDTHALYTIKCLEAGKAVYVEKPMAKNLAECMAMIDVSKKTGVPFYVAYYRRMMPGFLKVKELVDTGVIGKPLFCNLKFLIPARTGDLKKEYNWRVDPSISGGGYLFDLGCHQLDLIDYILGPLENIKALCFNQAGIYSPEDCISAGFTIHDQIIGNAFWHFSAPEYCQEDLIEIAGEKGKIVFSTFGFTPTRLEVDGKTTMLDNPRPEHVQQPMIEAVVNTFLGNGSCPGTPEAAMRTNKVLEEITKPK